MDSIIEKLYGGGAGSKPYTPPSRPNYYGSFEYFRNPDAPPPPASEGGPTAYQIAQHEGLLDSNGMLSNGMSPIVSAMYGGGIGPISPANNASNPDYLAGLNGKTVGGIGDLDGWAQPINWSTPQGGIATEGTVFETPLGNYTVSTNPWGQYVLVPQEGAAQTHSPYITNMTQGKHHFGINPETGEVWYQEAAGYTNYDLDNPSGPYYENPNGPGYTPPGSTNPNSNPNSNSGNNNSNAQGAGSSWLDVLSRGGNDLESWDQYLGLFTGLGSNPDWSSMTPAKVESTFDQLAGQGLFAGLDLASVYQRLLENLGLA